MTGRALGAPAATCSPAQPTAALGRRSPPPNPPSQCGQHRGWGSHAAQTAARTRARVPAGQPWRGEATSAALALAAPCLAPGTAPCCASSNFPLFTRELAAGPSRTRAQGLEPCGQWRRGAEGLLAVPWGCGALGRGTRYLWGSRALGLSRQGSAQSCGAGSSQRSPCGAAGPRGRCRHCGLLTR